MAEPPKFYLFNSMSKKKEELKPKEAGRVGMYVCGITAYDYSHIGHARAYVAFDILYRYLQYLGYEVTYVRNFTDVDDKIIKRANELGEDPLSLSDRYCQEFLNDMDALNCLTPTHQPRVSDHMEQIKDMIAKIIENDYAYPVDGDVYFSVDKFPSYGKLSGRKQEDNRAGERVAVDSRKRNPADFALWKAAKPGEPKWESPWGEGRPGWHIECSAMSAHYLTYSFDIHGGGMDLTFPHHENELAQSCAACAETNISYWVHNGFVTVDDEKMSKSLGNFFTIREVTKLYHPLALRCFLMGLHYRSPVNYSFEQIEHASEQVYYFYEGLQACEETLARLGSSNATLESNSKTERTFSEAKNLRDDFQSKMADDLHAFSILTGSLKDAFKFINASITRLKKKMQKKEQLALIQSLVAVEKQAKEVLNVLGLLSSLPYSEVLRQLKDKALARARMTEDDILVVIEERDVARKNKDYARSDQIRQEMLAKGIGLMDAVGSGPTTWRPLVPTAKE